jgi:hypothetical protein
MATAAVSRRLQRAELRLQVGHRGAQEALQELEQQENGANLVVSAHLQDIVHLAARVAQELTFHHLWSCERIQHNLV